MEGKDYELLKEFFYDKLNFCGCGNPEDTLLFIAKFLTDYDRTQKEMWGSIKDGGHESYDRHINQIKRNFDFREDGNNDIQNGLIQFVMYHLDSVGVLEHGGSIGGSWLTKYGREVVDTINKYPEEEIEYVLR